VSLNALCLNVHRKPPSTHLGPLLCGYSFPGSAWERTVLSALPTGCEAEPRNQSLRRKSRLAKMCRTVLGAIIGVSTSLITPSHCERAPTQAQQRLRHRGQSATEPLPRQLDKPEAETLWPWKNGNRAKIRRLPGEDAPTS
jgi:hypothetical protein